MNRDIQVLQGSRVWYGLAGLIVVADQAAKGAVAHAIAYGEALKVTEIFNLVHARNDGVAFSLLAGAGQWSRPALILIALGISVWLVRALRLRLRRGEALGYALILGGALGNVLDRVLRGAVVDFLDVHWQGLHWPAFNLADASISVGVACLLVAVLTPVRVDSPDARVG